jgi:hypothetical protein
MTIFILTLAMLFMSYHALTQRRDHKRTAKLKPIPLKIDSTDTTHKRHR